MTSSGGRWIGGVVITADVLHPLFNNVGTF